MALTILSENPNPPSGFGLNEQRFALAAEVNRTIREIETNGVTTTGDVSADNLTLSGGATIGGDLTFTAESDHIIHIENSTTAATNGGTIEFHAGDGMTSGNGGDVFQSAGDAGTTGNGGALLLEAGAGGATSGNGGAITITSGGAAVGASGNIEIITNNTASGRAGDIIFRTGTQTSTTVKAVISLEKAVVRKPESTSVASGGTITGVQLVGGLITATGATGNWQLPTAAQITTAIGSTPAGTNFEFVFNAAGMTATNTATLVVGANMTVASAPAITGGGTLTVTQDTQVTAGFRVVYDTTTTCKIYRIW